MVMRPAACGGLQRPHHTRHAVPRRRPAPPRGQAPAAAPAPCDALAPPIMPARIYADGRNKDSKQGWASWVIAVATMTLYTGWMHVLIGMFFASFFSRAVLAAFAVILSTLLLPPKPVLWTAFCQNPVFSTWRDYFRFRWGRGAARRGRRHAPNAARHPCVGAVAGATPPGRGGHQPRSRCTTLPPPPPAQLPE